MLKKVLQVAGLQPEEQRKATLLRRLMRREAEIGGKLFGPVSKGGSRQFFCLDENTWIWHEEWLDKSGKSHARTTRYEVRPNGIVKAQDGQAYQLLSKREAAHLADAVQAYEKRVKRELYQVSAPGA